MALEIKTYQGPDAKHLIEDIGALRIEIFRDYPYLYIGDMDYERSYLETYLSCPDSFIAVVFDQGRIVGASTAIPMRYEEEAFKAPFLKAGYDPDEFVYFGESILLEQYRGQGIGKKFFELREEYARKQRQTRYTCFCAVVRQEADPRAPAGYTPLNGFWESLSYRPIDGLVTTYSWKELGEKNESPKRMQFWLKSLKS